MDEKGTVIFVDDDPDDQYIFRTTLTKVAPNVELLCIPDGRSLEHYLCDEPIEVGSPKGAAADLILLDLNMAIQDGKTTLKRLKTSASFRHIPVIIYSTSSSSLDIKEAYDLGANSFIVKPACVTNVEKTVKNLCAYWLDSVSLIEHT